MSDDFISVQAPARPIKLPNYRRHKASGQAVVTIAGRDVYLGAYGTAASKAEYKRRIAEFLASGGAPPPVSGNELSVADLVLRYWKHVCAYYKRETRDGTIKPTLRRVRKLYGPTSVKDFGPLKLKAFRQTLIDERDEKGRRLSRPYINRSVRMVRSIFKWGVGEELVPAGVFHGLLAVEGLRLGRSDAPEPPGVRAVPDATVEATLPHLCPTVADMVRLQRLTGMRPGEVCRMTAAELDTTGEVWLYAPRAHKTAHHGKSRIVAIGPRARAVLERHLGQDLSAPLFSPKHAVQEQKESLRAANRTPFTPSRLVRDRKRARRPKRRLNEFYTTCTYAQAIRRACEKANLPPWAPNQLRHTKATELRKQFGLDGAGAILGHSKLETTQIYAERAAELAESIAAKTG